MPQTDHGPSRSFGLSRRATLQASLALAVATLFGAVAVQAQDSASSDGQTFDFEILTERMRQSAQEPYAAPEPLAGPAAELSYDQYRRLRFDLDRARWAGAEAPFVVHAYPLGWLFKEPVELHELVDGVARPMTFGPEDFEADKPVEEILSGEGAFPGVAGFRLNAALNDPIRYDEVVSFLGASYFRALGQGNVYGLSARGLAVNTATGDAEEFPRFSAFWLERPAPGADQITFYAALDSASVTGAYRFVLRPGKTTSMEVEARLFLREDVRQIGIAPLTSMYLFGPSDAGAFDDYRPAVHDSEGLVMVSGGRHQFRQLANPPRLANSYFGMQDPQAFGLVQRSREFEAYLDAGARYEKRPSLVVEPLGQWGAGTVRLIEIPSELEANDNIVAFWVPERELRAGDEATFSYRLHWGASPPFSDPEAAQVTRTMTGKGGVSGVAGDTGHRKFVVDFTGGKLGEPTDPMTVEPRLSATGGEIAESVLSAIEGTGIWRLVLEVDAEPGTTVELRADLVAGKTPVSETWLYQWQTE